MTKRVLSEAERIDWLRLARTPNVGPVTFAQLLARFGTPAAALKALPDLASRAGRSRPLKPPAPADIEAELAATRDYGASVIAACEPDYPKLLAGLDPPPPVLTVLGQVALLVEAAERSGSLISARTAGEQGREVMAVPGSPLDPRAAGTNHLIQQGAAVVRSGEDVIEILSGIGLSRFEAGPPSVFNTPPDTDRRQPIRSHGCARPCRRTLCRSTRLRARRTLARDAAQRSSWSWNLLASPSPCRADWPRSRPDVKATHARKSMHAAAEPAGRKLSQALIRNFE